jgi:hypothetical protein
LTPLASRCTFDRVLDETAEVIASYLRPDEAGMLCGLLESAGIPATIRDGALSSVNPLLQNAIGGAKLAVRSRDAERAREIISSSGVASGSESHVLHEIPEEEWSRPWTERAHLSQEAAAPPSDAASALAERALLAAVVGTALLFPVLHVYALWVVGRFLALPGKATRTARTKAVAASALAAMALIAASSLTLHLLRG